MTIVAVPAPNSALRRSARSFKPASPSHLRLGRASAVLIFLPGLAAGLPVSLTGMGTAAASAFGLKASVVAGLTSATFFALARIMSSLLGALGPVAGGSGVGIATEAGASGWRAAIFR